MTDNPITPLSEELADLVRTQYPPEAQAEVRRASSPICQSRADMGTRPTRLAASVPPVLPGSPDPIWDRYRARPLSWPVWMSAVHPAILVSGSADWHLIRFSRLLHPVAAIAMLSKRQEQKTSLPVTFIVPASCGSRATPYYSCLPVQARSGCAASSLRDSE
jgi:hypothetical protein